MKIVFDAKKNKLGDLMPHRAIVGDPDELVDPNVGEWSKESVVYTSTNSDELGPVNNHFNQT